jgi:hypothetical protein
MAQGKSFEMADKVASLDFNSIRYKIPHISY